MTDGPWWRDKDEFTRRWESAGWNLVALADAEGISRGTAQNWKDRHRLDYPEGIDPKGNHRNSRRRVEGAPPPPPLVPILDQELWLQGDGGVSSDWHAPVTRYEVFSRWLDDCDRHGLYAWGVCAGDLFNGDKWSRHDHKQDGAGPGPERESAEYMVSAALDVFEQLVVTYGNHDESKHRKLDYAEPFHQLVRDQLSNLPSEKLDRIVVTGRDYVMVDTERGPWRLCHTRAYSKIPLAYPGRLALRHGCHVAAGHRHHHAQGRAGNGKDIVELGGFHDEARMAYANRWTNDFPEMSNGYMLLRDGWADLPMLRS